MKVIKGRIAVILVVCMIATSVMPAYAFEDNTILMQEERIEEEIIQGEIMEEESAEEATEAEAFESVMAADAVAEEIIPEEDDVLTEGAGDELLGAGEVTETVTYIDENREEKQAENCIIISENASDYSMVANCWYAIRGNVTINNRIHADNSPEQHSSRLILMDGATLTVPGGINVPGGSSLIIYGQSESDNTGKLICKLQRDDDYNKAAIGGGRDQAAGTIKIYGGDITAEACQNFFSFAAGIGGGTHSPNGKVIIGGGKVTARGSYAAGIGGCIGSGGTILISGGEVTAHGNNGGAGIGGGSRGSGGNITVTGGKVTAYGGKDGAGIGGGKEGDGGNITIIGGEVTATGGENAAGIGGGYDGSGGNITITGGTVTVNGGTYGAGIGGGRYQNSGTIDIKGGTIDATGGDMGAGIGGGYDNYKDYNGTVTINGGSIIAFGGNYAAGIGAGEKSPHAQGYIIPQISLGGVASVQAGSSAEDQEIVPVADYIQDVQNYRYVSFDHTYTITWSTPGGEVTTPVRAGETPKFPDNEKSKLEKTGYVFTGWADADGKDVHPAAGDTIYTAQYHIERILIIDAQGADYEPDTIVYTDENAIVTEPKGPVREGYTFKGWYENVEGSGNAFTFNRTVSETFGANLSLTIYAKWEINSYTIKWKKATDSVAYTATSVRYGDTPEYPEEWKEGLKKEGYVFIGWKDEQGQDIQTAKSDKTYIAQYQYEPEVQTWYLIYDAQGTEYLPDYEVYTEATATISAPANPEKEGYTFSGWYDNAEGTGDPFVFGRKVADSFGEAYEYLVLYAKWTKNSYIITWKATDSDGSLETIDTTTASYSDVPQITPEKKSELIQNLTNRNLVFTGWADADGKDVHAATADTTYFAQYYTLPEETYYLILDAQGGNLKKDFEKYTADDATVTTPSEVPVKPGYTFQGWSATSSDAGELFVFGRTAAETFGSDKIKTLYAKWSPEAFTITWKKAVDGIEKASTSETYNYGEMPYFKGSFSLDEEGCRFEGWTPELRIVRENKTYITRYQKEDLIVSFDTDGGSFIAPIITVYGDTVERPATPSKTGYIFKGWYKEDKLTEFDFATEKITEDITIYAVWEAIPKTKHTIRWVDYNDSVLKSVQLEEGSLPDYGDTKPSRSGYIFTGWTPKIALVTGDATYKATYEAKSSGGGGGGGGSSSGGGSSVRQTPQVQGAVTGNWTYHANTGKWTFAVGSYNYFDQWALIANPYASAGQAAASWFYFDAQGNMMTGWQWIKGANGITRCYYLNPLPDNTQGACFIGPGTTPDGWTVDANGAWTVNGVVQTR